MTQSSRPPIQTVSGELVERLNHRWRLFTPDAAQLSLKQRLAAPARRALARLMGPQETFNSTVVQFVNEWVGVQARQHEHLQAVIDAAMDEVARDREALAARERRMEAAMHAIRAEHEELRTSLATVHQLTHNLARDMAAIRGAGAPSRDSGPAEAGHHGSGARLQGDPGDTRGVRLQADQVDAPGVHLDTRGVRLQADHVASDALSYKYVGFEDQFRGSPEQIREGLAEYVPIFTGASDVLDVGCGRGEFLALLRDKGITGRGIDLNDSMIEVCRGKGLDATHADALSYLRAQPDGSLGGLFAAQVVEHLDPGYLTQLLDAAFDKLRPGAPIVLETINPACWFAFFESYIRDITHVRPLHPDTLKFLLMATGFQQLAIRYRAPYPEHEKLQAIPTVAALADSVATLNANVEKINRLLFTYLDYAAIGRRP